MKAARGACAPAAGSLRDRRAKARARAARASLSGDEGISNVVGAILLFAIFILTLVTIQARYTPVWDEDREARLMGRIQGQLALLKSDLDHQVDNRTDVPATDPLTLSSEPGFSFFQGARLPATASFQAAGTAGGAVSVESPRINILEQNGKSFLGIVDPTGWVPLSTGQQYTAIASVRVLRVQIPWPDGTADCNTDLTSILHVSDASGDELAKAELTCHDASSERTIHTNIFRRDSESDPWEEVSSDTEAIFQNAEADFFYVDLLDPALLFDVVLAGLDTPLVLDMENLGLAASYILVYDDTAGGTNGASGSAPGLTILDYGPVTYEPGALLIEAHNQQYVDQTFILEHGAILVEQDAGAAMVVPPLMRFSDSGTQTIFEWILPSLSGASQSFTGSSSVSLIADPSGERFEMRAVAGQLTIDIPSSHPDVWADYLDRALRDLGFTEGTGAGDEFDLDTDADSCTLTLESHSAAAATDDILFEFHQADIGLELRASG